MTNPNHHPKPIEEPKTNIIAAAIGVAVVGTITLWHLAQPVIDAFSNN